jgi:hypothetical protein
MLESRALVSLLITNLAAEDKKRVVIAYARKLLSSVPANGHSSEIEVFLQLAEKADIQPQTLFSAAILTMEVRDASNKARYSVDEAVNCAKKAKVSTRRLEKEWATSACINNSKKQTGQALTDLDKARLNEKNAAILLAAANMAYLSLQNNVKMSEIDNAIDYAVYRTSTQSLLQEACQDCG